MKRRDANGFSLVEVVLALGLMAGTLISISGLFALASRQVKSGRSGSEALAVSRSILEEMERWSLQQTYELYGYDGTGTAYNVDSRINAYASKWQPTLDEKFLDGYAQIQLASLSQAGPTPNMSDTRAIRVVVTIHWDEAKRHRMVRLGTVKM